MFALATCSLKGVFQPRKTSAAIITSSANSRIIVETDRKGWVGAMEIVAFRHGSDHKGWCDSGNSGEPLGSKVALKYQRNMVALGAPGDYPRGNGAGRCTVDARMRAAHGPRVLAATPSRRRGLGNLFFLVRAACEQVSSGYK